MEININSLPETAQKQLEALYGYFPHLSEQQKEQFAAKSMSFQGKTLRTCTSTMSCIL